MCVADNLIRIGTTLHCPILKINSIYHLICTAKLQAFKHFSRRYWLRGQGNANTRQKERRFHWGLGSFNWDCRLGRTSQGKHECNKLKWIGELTVIQTPLSSDKYNGTRIPYVSLPKKAFRLPNDIKARGPVPTCYVRCHKTCVNKSFSEDKQKVFVGMMVFR